MKRNLAMPMPSWRSLSLPEGRLGFYLAPVAALIYPAVLWSFHLSVNAFEAGERELALVAAASLSLAMAFVLPGLVLLAALHLAGINKPNALQLRARKVALLAVAAPTIFVFLGVLLYMADASLHEAAAGPSLPIGDVRFNGEFQRDRGLVVLTWSFVEIDLERSYAASKSCNAVTSYRA